LQAERTRHSSPERVVLEALDRDAVFRELQRRLSDLPGYVKAVLLFGSLARGEAGERSDVDLLLLHDNAPLSDPVELRKHLYELVAERLAGAFEPITVVDVKLEAFLRPKVVTSLLLNIYADAVVVVDRVGGIEEFLEKVRRRARDLGLRRLKDGRAYCWALPRPMERAELL